MATQITKDSAYDAVAPDDFPAMLEVERYGKRSTAFDKIISATHDHFWDPLDKKYIDFTEPFDLTKDMMLAFGGVFELPILIYFLAMAGVVTPKGLWKFNRWFIVLAFIIGAILTPSPDVVSQILMALPMIVLYNLSILVSFLVIRKREKAMKLPA